jgi:hypothetical protein
MSDDFERELRLALQPVDPPEGFAERVLAKQAQESSRPTFFERVRMYVRPERGWLIGAIAATSAFVAVAVVVEQRRDQREREGLEARKQLIEALRVTSEKLDLAYQAVNAPSRPKESGV